MLIRKVFIDCGDEFYIDDYGDLAYRNSDSDTTTIISKDNIRAFAKFLHDETEATTVSVQEMLHGQS